MLNSTLNFNHNKKKEQYLNCRSEKYKDIITEEKVKREAAKRTNIDGSEDECFLESESESESE